MHRPGLRYDAVIREAVRRRAQARPPYPLDAYRLVNGRGDGAPPSLALDRYGEWLVAHARVEVEERIVEAWCDAAEHTLSPRGLVLKRWAPRDGRSSSRIVRGAPLAGPLPVREDDVTLWAELSTEVQTGVFLDHRETRRFVRRFADGAEVLNGFAYTSAFSVHVAKAGAARVTSVDVSKRALARGRANMEASGIDPNRHRWFAEDLLRHVGRGRAAVYDLIILDPPLMGRAGGRTFSLLNDLDRLMQGSVHKLRPDGVLVFSTHALELREQDLEDAARRAAAAAGRSTEVVARMGLPAWDHPAPPPTDQDRGAYLKTLVLRFGGK